MAEADTTGTINLVDVRPSAARPNPSEVKGTVTSVGKTTSLDDTRQMIAYILLGALIFVILLSAILSALYASPCLKTGAGMHEVCASAQTASESVAKTMTGLLTAMIGLVGSVVGFYFGSSQKTSG